MDQFKRHGMDDSYTAREKLFRKYCELTNYKGTPEENEHYLMS